MPIAMSVNMFRLRLTSDAQPRWKNGQPPQRTTGVASASCAHRASGLESHSRTGPSGHISPMASNSTGTLRQRLTQNRRVMSSCSGLRSSPAVTMRGSSAMPQMGHAPGPGRTISGCMGQVYSAGPGPGAGAGTPGDGAPAGSRNRSGSASNRALQLAAQKWNVWPR
jgi:hypothetical protein